jgi:hypothetical protein
LPPAGQEQFQHFIYIDIVTGHYALCSDDAKFMNHSDSPNTTTLGEQTMAIRDLPVGAGLTGDFREFDASTRAVATALVATVPVPNSPYPLLGRGVRGSPSVSM